MATDFTQRVQKYKNVSGHEQAAKGGADIVQLKYDGWWARAVVDAGVAAVFSRQGQLKHTQPVNLPNCVLIGEFLKGTQRVVSGTEGQHSSLIVFDILELRGRPVHFRKYEDRTVLFRKLHMDYLTEWTEPCSSFPFDQCDELWNRHVEQGNCEGLVYKRSLDPYVGSTVWRRKKEFTMDYVVMGFEEGEGKHAGRLGALICGLVEDGTLIEKVRVGGGFNDEEREDIWVNAKNYVGRVLEVKGWQIFDSGAMRHPNAVRGHDGKLRWRTDKKRKDCVWPQP